MLCKNHLNIGTDKLNPLVPTSVGGTFGPGGHLELFDTFVESLSSCDGTHCSAGGTNRPGVPVPW